MYIPLHFSYSYFTFCMSLGKGLRAVQPVRERGGVEIFLVVNLNTNVADNQGGVGAKGAGMCSEVPVVCIREETLGEFCFIY